MLRRPEELGQLLESDDFRLAVPTPDHFVPLAYISGLSDATGATTSTFAEGCTMGSLSMTSYRIDR